MSPDVVAPYVFGIAALIVGLLLSVSGGLDLWRGLSSHRWPATRGRVVGHLMGTGSHLSALDDAIAVIYEYRVGNLDYRSQRFDYAGRNPWTRASAVMRLYPVGHLITVLYDPSNPSRAVLRPGVGAWNYFPVLAGVPLLAIGAYATLGFLRLLAGRA